MNEEETYSGEWPVKPVNKVVSVSGQRTMQAHHVALCQIGRAHV